MRAARNEGDIRAGLCQRSAKSASDAAGADHRNPHQLLLMMVIPRARHRPSAVDVAGSM
jgi:hypothetical protein